MNTETTPAPSTSSSAVATLGMVNIDCAHPQRLAEFYSAVLGWPVTFAQGDYAMISGDAGNIGFGRVEGYQPPAWPDETHTKRFHLDLSVPSIPAAEAACCELGASVPDFQPGQRWRVLLDPDGHPFCLSELTSDG